MPGWSDCLALAGSQTKFSVKPAVQTSTTKQAPPKKEATPAGPADTKDKVQAEEAQPKSFSMNELIERLKKSDAIGFLTKLTLRSDALDLVDMVKAYKRHTAPYSLSQLHARFNGLLLKVLALLNDDPRLSKDISMARDEIWKNLLEVKA